jgi:hypothetical protein
VAPQVCPASVESIAIGCVHHPDPDPYGLLRFAATQGRSDEFVEEIGRPSAALFQDFCAHLVAARRLDRTLVHDRAVDICPEDSAVTITLGGGDRLRARHVVLATGAMRAHRPPGAPANCLHSVDIDLARIRLAGRRIVVVGGGLTAAQLALAAEADGAYVDLLCRKALFTRPLDIEPTWLGRRLPAFFAERDPLRRADLLRQARARGSIPAHTAHQLTENASGRTLRLHQQCAVKVIEPCEHRWRIVSDHGVIDDADQVWLATGYTVAVANEPLLDQVQACHPTPIIAGLPLLDNDLIWPGTRLHLTGGLAALSIGPAAQNIAGARIAAERVAMAIAGRLPYAQPPVPATVTTPTAFSNLRSYPDWSPRARLRSVALPPVEPNQSLQLAHRPTMSPLGRRSVKPVSSAIRAADPSIGPPGSSTA